MRRRVPLLAGLLLIAAARPAVAQRIYYRLVRGAVTALELRRADAIGPSERAMIAGGGIPPGAALDSVEAGAPVAIIVASQGGGCGRPGPVRVESRGNTLTLRVSDYVVRNLNVSCPRDRRLHVRTVRQVFRRPGTQVITAIGTPGSVITRTLTVLPRRRAPR
jgi:hypothetical protein